MPETPFPSRPNRDHLRRLHQIWIPHPVIFLTLCTAARRPLLTRPGIPEILVQAWLALPRTCGWSIGRYVVMPDHVHCFASAGPEAKPLSAAMRDWKKWTARHLVAALGVDPPIWQPEFFDHLLRSAPSYAEKWDYVRQNPVRAGLVARPEDWPHAGEIADLRVARGHRRV
jgi:REP element-mobilizing transposase RayT